MANNNDFLRVAVRWDFAGAGDQVNVYTLRITEGLATIDDGDVSDGIIQWLTVMYDQSGITAFMPNELVHQDVFISNITQNSVLPPIGNLPILDGLNITDPLPTGASAMVLGRTGVPRRVARKYLPTFTEGDQSGGVWNGVTIDALEEFGEAWVTPLSTSFGFDLSAWVGPDTGLSISPITTYSVRPVVAYQRRRKAGVGS